MFPAPAGMNRADDPELSLVLWLVKNGVDLDVAASLPPDDRLAWAIICGRFEGIEFDFARMAWKEH